MPGLTTECFEKHTLFILFRKYLFKSELIFKKQLSIGVLIVNLFNELWSRYILLNQRQIWLFFFILESFKKDFFLFYYDQEKYYTVIIYQIIIN